jgi:hypothetical protein
MYSIWFYFMPNGTAFEACGYPDKESAMIAAASSACWFKDEGGNDIYISHALKQTAVIKIAPQD